MESGKWKREKGKKQEIKLEKKSEWTRNEVERDKGGYKVRREGMRREKEKENKLKGK